MTGWKEGYEFLADLLIGIEEDMKKKNLATEGKNKNQQDEFQAVHKILVLSWWFGCTRLYFSYLRLADLD